MRTICGVWIDGCLVEKDMSEKLGKFSPLQLVYFRHITYLDISGMCDIVPTDLIDFIQFCSELKEIHMKNCKHFHEHQLATILSPLLKLEKVDCTNATPVVFLVGYAIISSLKKLQYINLMPKYPETELRSWHWLVVNFKSIHFGPDIMNI